MTRLKVVPLIFLLGLCSTAYADAIREGSLNAKSTASGVYVWWYSSDESNVTRFEVWRSSAATNQWVKIADRTPKGNGSYYDFDDETAFRLTDSFYQYRVRTVFSDRPSVDSPPVGVMHNTNSVRRTWGSIKAMFR